MAVKIKCTNCSPERDSSAAHLAIIVKCQSKQQVTEEGTYTGPSHRNISDLVWNSYFMIHQYCFDGNCCLKHPLVLCTKTIGQNASAQVTHLFDRCLRSFLWRRCYALNENHRPRHFSWGDLATSFQSLLAIAFPDDAVTFLLKTELEWWWDAPDRA